MRSDPSLTATAASRGLRAAHLVRAGVLVAVGVAIAFTAPLHRELGFDLWVLGGGLALIGAATLLEYFTLRDSAESWWVAARAIIAFAAAVSLFAVSDTLAMALDLALWAALTAGITGMRLARGAQPAQSAVPSLLLSAGLAAVVLACHDDVVALIGLFGAYAIIRGVFLGIAAFDHRPAKDAALTPAQG